MSNRIQRACRILALIGTPKVVLMCLSDHADDTGKAWPSIPTIERWAGCGRSAVKVALKQLEAEDWVRVDRSGDHNIMWLNVDRICRESAAQDALDKAASRPGRRPNPGRETTGDIDKPGSPNDGGLQEKGGRQPAKGGRLPAKGGSPNDQTPVASRPLSIKEASVEASKEASVAQTAATTTTEQPDDLFPDSADASPPAKVSESALTVKAKKSGKSKPEGVTVPTREAFKAGFKQQYGIEPVLAAKENGQFAQLVKTYGAEEAPKLAAFFFVSGHPFHAQRGHPIDLLVKDAQQLRTQMLTGNRPGGDDRIGRQLRTAALMTGTYRQQDAADAAARVAAFAPAAAARSRQRTQDFTDIDYREDLPDEQQS